MENSGFSQPPVLCSLAAFLESTACTKPECRFAWFFIQGLFTARGKKPLIKCRNTYAQGNCREQCQKFGLHSNHASCSPQSGQLESRILQTVFSKNAISLQNGQSTSKTESPKRPFWRVHWQVLESTCLVRQECPRNLRIPALHL